MVAHGRADVVRQTLEGLAHCEQPDSFQGLILVENGPPCGMSDVVAEFQTQLRIEHITIDSPQKTLALNHALRRIGTGWALFIDDDVRVKPDWIAVYADAIAREPQGYYFGGPTSVDYEQRPPDWLIPFFPLSARGLEFSDNQLVIKHPTCFLGFNWAARVSTLLELGGFPSQFGPGTPLGGGDESLMQMQLSQMGQIGRIIPEALVWHQIPVDRCTPEWTLKRFYGGGQATGILAATFEQRSPRWFGSLRCRLRHYRGRVSSAPLRHLIRLDCRGKFWIRQTLAWVRGFSTGYHKAMRGEFRSLLLQSPPLIPFTQPAKELGEPVPTV